MEIFNTDHPKYAGSSGSFQNQQIKVIHKNERDIVFKFSIPSLATLVLEEHLA
jgi:hypothetical protein